MSSLQTVSLFYMSLETWVFQRYFDLSGTGRVSETQRAVHMRAQGHQDPHYDHYEVMIWGGYLKREAWSTCLYLPRILLTQPWLTRSCLEMSQGLTPWWASSTILWRTTSGSGRPFTKTPPSWFTPPCPEIDQKQKARERVVRTSHTVEVPL